jgi:predicted nucleotidyltransferase component of viral defense system
VTQRPLKNVADSIHQRLLNKARETGRPFGELLQYYAMERFLYRLSRSAFADRFVLKGALMLTMWRAPLSRSTKDIDLLGRLPNRINSVAAAVRKICRQDVEPDGIEFDPETVKAERIVEDADYEGVRVRFRGKLGTARITMQVDIGFGDIVVPPAQAIDYPTILESQGLHLLGYSRESVVAEKLEAMVRLGALNSRMKDFFDIWLLCRQFDFNGRTLAKAIQTTFSNRRTPLPARPLALTKTFTEDLSKATQWQGFIRKGRLDDAPGGLAELVQVIATFLLPVTEALAAGRDFKGTWVAPGPWKKLALH